MSKRRRELGITSKALREMCHSIQKTAKEVHKYYEQFKSKHTVPLDLNYGHKTWSICTDRIAAAECATSMNEVEQLYDKWGRK